MPRAPVKEISTNTDGRCGYEPTTVPIPLAKGVLPLHYILIEHGKMYFETAPFIFTAGYYRRLWVKITTDIYSFYLNTHSLSKIMV